MGARLRKSLLCWLVLAPLVAVILFMFAVCFFTAVKPRQEIFVYPATWLPREIRWRNFVEMWREKAIGTALLNSLYVSGASTLLTLLAGVPAAYALARFRFPGQGLYRQFLLVTQMLSPIVLIVGLFRLVAFLGLTDSLNALVLTYTAFNLAFAVWMLQSYFATIPADLEEAAWMEGAGRGRSLVSVFLPLAVPAMVVTAIFTFINSWNEFVVALTVLRSQDRFTLPIQVFSLVGGRYSVDWDHVMAATLVATVPVAVVFAWLQRYLVKGLALGAVK